VGNREWGRVFEVKSGSYPTPHSQLPTPSLWIFGYGSLMWRPDFEYEEAVHARVDGWRRDVAFDIGFAVLDELTRAAHAEKPGSLVVGELANYPKEWHPSVDAVMHFALRHLVLRLADGQLDAPTFGRMVTRMVEDTGIENMLKSWIYLDNHDTPRLATRLPDARARRLAQVLQFTLPGAPNLYYGGEVDLPGGDDPEMRAPMRWDLVTPDNAALAWTKKLIALHRGHRALRVGNYRPITTNRLFGFERHTDRVADTVLVLANPADEDVTETVMVANSKLMDGTPMVDLVGDCRGEPLRMRAALLRAIRGMRSSVVRPRSSGISCFASAISFRRT